MIKNLRNFVFMLVAVAGLTGCSSTVPNHFPNYKNSSTQVENRQKIMTVYKQWKGTPYRLGGTSKKGIDCSAFTQIVYHDALHEDIKRTTALQKSQGSRVSLSNVKVGDLVFFLRNTHVGVYIGNGKFIHASTSKGVIISSFKEKYYRKNYTQTRRVL